MDLDWNLSELDEVNESVVKFCGRVLGISFEVLVYKYYVFLNVFIFF